MFKVGQKVVCIKAHSQGVLTVGAIYTVAGNFHCCHPLIDVGLDSNAKKWHCSRCNLTIEGEHNRWVSEHLFAPIEEKSNTEVSEEGIIQWIPNESYQSIKNSVTKKRKSKFAPKLNYVP